MQKVQLNSSFHVLCSAQNSIEINSRGENIHGSPTTLYYVEVPPYSLLPPKIKQLVNEYTFSPCDRWLPHGCGLVCKPI